MFAVLSVVGLPSPPVIEWARTLHVASNMASKRTEHEELRDRPRVRVTANGMEVHCQIFHTFLQLF